MTREVLEGIREFFAGIPEDAWCENSLENEAGQRCAYGHLFYEAEGSVFVGITDNFRTRFGCLVNDVLPLTLVSANNDSGQRLFKGATPKDRVLNRIDSFL